MELGPYELQIFTSLMVILGAAVGALLCDFLYGRQEQFRELTLASQMRPREERKSAILVTSLFFEEPPVYRAIASAERTALHGASDAQRISIPPAAQRGAETDKAVTDKADSRPASSSFSKVPLPHSRGEAHRPSASRTLTVRESSAPPVAMQGGRVLAQISEASLPAGFHEVHVLNRLIRDHKPISGLVVSIGVSAANEDGKGDISPVRDLIPSLLGPQDFACATSPDEYLLIFPDERGAEAQRHLAALAQQLWDFQLNRLSEASILFSWGGLEVHKESIEEAIASASERMQETRRGRSILAFETHGLRKAV
jgi:hypothetical protein